jgi:signal transduction histidine kinase/CHASE3 domain sensor protein/ActR/RegA family two-component response regulator
MPESLSPNDLGRRLFLYGTVPGILLLAAFAYLAVSAIRLDRSRTLVVHGFDVIVAADAIEVSMLNAERGQRGFLVTGEPKYREPYDREMGVIPGLVGRLRDLTADEPDQQRRIEILQQSVTTKLNELDRTIALNRMHRLDAAIDLTKTDVGENAMRAVQRGVDEIASSEEVLLEGRLESASRAERRVILGSLMAGALAVLGLAWITFELYRSYRRTYASESVLRATLDSVREGVSAFDGDHRLIAFNSLFLEILKLPPGSVARGLSLDEIERLKTGERLGGDLLELDARARAANRPLLVEDERPDGTVVELFHKPSADGGFVTTYIDATERRKAELAQRQAQKMESLGHLTGGIAHDFNNLLTIVVGNLGFLKSRLKGDARLLRHVDMAMMGADRAAKLTHQLLAFARRQPLAPRAVNLARLLPDLTELLRRTLGELIEIVVIETPDPWNVSIDPHQFESAVLNLAINARDAMPGGGKLILEMANTWLDDAYAASHDEVRAGQYVMFSVTDTGAGMSGEVMARAFDPFFSTKGEGGTGLGLSMVFGFVKQSGGHIRIESEPGKGASIKLYLPRTLETEKSSTDRGAGAGAPAGAETILAVEDEDAVRETVTSMLKSLGYAVLEAADGASALEILRGDRAIDLVFTDVVMPGPVGGRMLAEEARALRPGIKILFTSGYAHDSVVHDGRLDAGVELLGKPYSQEDLARKIREALEAPVQEKSRRP